jgi:hypothetical protein
MGIPEFPSSAGAENGMPVETDPARGFAVGKPCGRDPIKGFDAVGVGKRGCNGSIG